MISEDVALLIASLTQPLLILEGDRVLTANPAAERMLGAPPQTLAGRRLPELVADAPEKIADYLGACARSRAALPGSLTLPGSEASVQRCDGALLRPATSAAPALVMLQLRSREATVDRFLLLNRKIEALHREIRERKRVEQEREALLQRESTARAQAEEASRLKDEFLATLSHELRTPLTAILGWFDVLKEVEVDEALRTRAIEAIERNAVAQARLVDDLLDVSRIVSGRLRVEREPVVLADLVQEALDAVRPAADAKRIVISTAVADPAPRVRGDADRLRQVIWNLLSNAVKFTPSGGQVEVLLGCDGPFARIAVRDDGEGIEPDLLPHVFDRFRQADGSITRQHGGLGLGLSIVRHLVELHGGTVRAESAGKGCGAMFVVEVPLLEEPQAGAPPLRSSSA